jgi:hypothetical protein
MVRLVGVAPTLETWRASGLLLSYNRMLLVQMLGVEPRLQRWQRYVVPFDYTCITWSWWQVSLLLVVVLQTTVFADSPHQHIIGGLVGI